MLDTAKKWMLRTMVASRSLTVCCDDESVVWKQRCRSAFLPTSYTHKLWVGTVRMTSQIWAMEMSLLSRVSGLSFRDEERGTAHAERNQLRWFQGCNFQGVRRVMAPSIIGPGGLLVRCFWNEFQSRPRTLWRVSWLQTCLFLHCKKKSNIKVFYCVLLMIF